MSQGHILGWQEEGKQQGLLSHTQVSKERNLADRKQQKNKGEAKWNKNQKQNGPQ